MWRAPDQPMALRAIRSDELRGVSSAVEADVDDHALVAHGRIHQSLELRPAAGDHVGHVHVAEAPV